MFHVKLFDDHGSILIAIHFIIGSLLTALVTNAYASGEPTESVLVTATRRSAASDELPYSVSVLHRGDIDSTFARSLPDALAQSPGVSVQKSANGQGAPFLRGFTGYRTLVLIDGVRYNNSVYRDGPNEYFSLIDYNAVERVEVVGGPGSVLYGSDAIGGTLNLATRRAPYDSNNDDGYFVHGMQRVTYATVDHSQQSRSEVGFGRGGAFGVHIGNSLKQFGNLETASLGKQHHTGYGETAWDARLDLRLGSRWTLSSAVQYLKQDDVSRTFATIFAQPFAGTTIGSDKRRLKDQRREFGYVRLTGEQPLSYLDQVTLTLSRQGWQEDSDRVRADGRRSLEYFKSTMLGIDIQFDSRFSVVDFIYGFDLYHDSVDSARQDYFANGRLDQIRIQGPVGDDAHFRQGGVYLQAVLSPLERLRLEFGTRYSDVTAKIGRLEDPASNEAVSFKDSWNEFNHSARASVFFDEAQRATFWIGVSEAFRAPNVADLSRFGASRSNEIEVAATDLDPESFLTFELGLRRAVAAYNLSATAYHTRIRDYITSTPTGERFDALIEVSKDNSGRGFVRGIELSGGYRWRNGFKVLANLTWLEGELESFVTTDRIRQRTEPLSRIVPFTMNWRGSYTAPRDRYTVAVDVSYAARADELSAGDRNDIQRIPPGGTPAYEVVRVTAEKRLSRHLDIGLAFTNIFDATFRTHGSGVNEPGFGVDLRLTARF